MNWDLAIAFALDVVYLVVAGYLASVAIAAYVRSKGENDKSDDV